MNRVSPVLTPKTSQTTPYLSNAIELISYEIDKAICVNNDEQPKRKYLGGSSLGSLCPRQIQYRYMQVAPDEEKEFSARTLRIFDMGRGRNIIHLQHRRHVVARMQFLKKYRAEGRVLLARVADNPLCVRTCS